MSKTKTPTAAELWADRDNFSESDTYLWVRKVKDTQIDTWRAMEAIVEGAKGREWRAGERREWDKFAKQLDELGNLVRSEEIDRTQIMATSGDHSGSVTGDRVGFDLGTQGGLVGSRASAWTRQATETVRSAMTGQDGSLSVGTRSVPVAPPLSVRADPYPAPSPQRPTDPLTGQAPFSPSRVVDLLVNRRPLEDTNSFSYMRQTLRDNQAAVVADGEVKPTSRYAMEDIEDRVRVVAHLSEPIPMRAFEDSNDIGTFLETEMRAGLLDALEAEVLSGSGTGEHLQGLTKIAAIAQQDFVTDLPTSLRKARTRLRLQNEAPTAWVIHPEQQEAVDLLREGADGMFLAGTWTDNIVGRLPVIESTAVDPGVAILGDWSLLELVVRSDGRLDVDAGGELFKKNQAILRLEGRYGSAVRRTTAFCVVDVSAS